MTSLIVRSLRCAFLDVTNCLVQLRIFRWHQAVHILCYPPWRSWSPGCLCHLPYDVIVRVLPTATLLSHWGACVTAPVISLAARSSRSALWFVSCRLCRQQRKRPSVALVSARRSTHEWRHDYATPTTMRLKGWRPLFDKSLMWQYMHRTEPKSWEIFVFFLELAWSRWYIMRVLWNCNWVLPWEGLEWCQQYLYAGIYGKSGPSELLWSLTQSLMLCTLIPSVEQFQLWPNPWTSLKRHS